MSVATYHVDPVDPRAPSQEVWDALGPEARRRVLDALPSELPLSTEPEGDAHSRPKHESRETLGEHFRRIGRGIYLGSELPVYYPAERMLAPDLMAVLDVSDHERDHWTVSHEGRGLDFALEIHVRGRSTKDFVDNVERYARLGIQEYFAYAPRRGRLNGWRLPQRGARVYEPIVPQGGRWRSAVLDVDLAMEGGRLRFYHGSAMLLDTRELIAKLSAMVDGATERAEREAERAEQAARRLERYAAALREAGIDPATLDDEPSDD